MPRKTAQRKERSPIINVVKKASPAVVSIVVSKDLSLMQQEIPYDLFRFFWGLPPIDKLPKAQRKVRVGGGSGFIVSRDGTVITNRHVVADPKADYFVVTTKGDKLPAKVLERDSVYDIAVLKVEKKGLPVMKMGDSNNLELGQTVIAIGNALGEFANTVSTGIVSGLTRSITAQDAMSKESKMLRGLIQTDAAINPGNSGGPLLDIFGNAIGVNTAMVFGAENIDFALPINNAKRDLQQLKKHGRIRHAVLGIRYVLITPEIAEIQKLPVKYGAFIMRERFEGDLSVLPESAAAKAGLKVDDIILDFKNKKVSDDNPLDALVDKCESGQEVSMTIMRKGKRKKVKVKLGER